jgi:hypothetical protein
VSGLDDIGKLFKGVNPLDELDAGASGSSIQEVLVGSSIRIVIRRITMGANFVEEAAIKANHKIANRLKDESGNFKPFRRLRNEEGESAPFHGFRDSNGEFRQVKAVDIVLAARFVWRSSVIFFQTAENFIDKLFN